MLFGPATLNVGMILLLDENIPAKLRFRFDQISVYTVQELGWSGYSNGKLLQAMEARGIHALLTFDKSLEHQQNFRKYAVPVLVIHQMDNRYEALLPLIPTIERLVLEGLSPGPLAIP